MNFARTVCRKLSLDPKELQKKGRVNTLSLGKSLICHVGYHQSGITGGNCLIITVIHGLQFYRLIMERKHQQMKKNINLLD